MCFLCNYLVANIYATIRLRKFYGNYFLGAERQELRTRYGFHFNVAGKLAVAPASGSPADLQPIRFIAIILLPAEGAFHCYYLTTFTKVDLPSPFLNKRNEANGLYTLLAVVRVTKAI
jgi:hypothetical protein